MPTIAVFGSFDGLHLGHDALLREASRYGEVLVILAQDGVIQRLKGQCPVYPFADREEKLRAHACVARVVPSDAYEGEYRCVTQEKPEIIGFGYDQGELAEHFLAWKEKTGYHGSVVRFSPFHPEIYKSSLLRFL